MAAFDPLTSARILIHAGFVRTGTTTLQERAFRKIAGVHYLGRPFRHAEVAAAITGICKTDGVRYCASTTRAVLERHLDPQALNVLSYENLASFKAKDKALAASRLHELFPHARILFTLRNQRDLVRSWYLLLRGSRRFVAFDAWWAQLANDPSRSLLDDINFDDVVACYEKLFGVSSVGVFLYEELRDDPDLFAQNVSSFMGIDAAPMANALKRHRLNAGATGRQLAWSKFLASAVPDALIPAVARLIPKRASTRFSDWQAAGGRPDVPLSPDQDRLITKLCAAGNRRLSERRGLPLAHFKYPL